MLRLIFAILTVIPLCSAQNFPAFRWAQEVDGSGMDQFTGVGADAAGNIYVAGITTSPNFPVKSAVQNHLASPGLNDVFITKLDPNGNVLYSTYFGGTGDDIATAMTVDAAGNVYVTGTTTSLDFPTTPGTYSPSVPPKPAPGPVFLVATSFVFKLNPDGSVGYSTYFSSSQTKPNAIAVDSAGSVYLTGLSYGGLATTPGAYQTICNCAPEPTTFLLIGVTDGFLARFDSYGSKLIYSTYLGVPNASGNALAVAADGSAYLAGPTGAYRIDASGSSLLGSTGAWVITQALAVAPDGSVYLAGAADFGPFVFQPTAGAFQTVGNPLPVLPLQRPQSLSAVVKMDSQLHQVLAGTYFSGVSGATIKSMAVDATGNVYIGGYTTAGLPTRTPMVEGFGSGFASELSGDLSSLLFSGYFGADLNFGVEGVAVASNGSTIIAGTDAVSPRGNIWVNSLALTTPPTLRIDSIVNAASLIDGSFSAGETILVRGAGFTNDAQLMIGGSVIPTLSITATEIAATFPASVPNGAAEVVVQSGSGSTNPVLIPVATTSPGIFSANGNGYGQGYILNKDGTLNTSLNPAAVGDQITIYATGVGPISFVDGFAVTQFPSNVFIDGTYCPGVAAFLGPVPGFPGNVYQLTVYVPTPVDSTFPALNSLILQLNGVPSQPGIAISVAQ